MDALATRTIYDAKPLIILQRIAGKERGEVPLCGEADGKIFWLVKKMNIEGEPDFTRLYDSTGGLLFALLLRVLPDSRAAEETLKGIFTEFKREVKRFGAPGEKPLMWLIGIADCYDIERLPLGSQFESFKTSDGQENGTHWISESFPGFSPARNRLEKV